MIFYRLRSLLGTRNDDDVPGGPSRFGYDASAFGEARPAKTQPHLRVVTSEEAEEEGPIVGLARYQEIDPSFDEQRFLEGAQRAYEIILKAFAAGDKSQLEPLLTEDVYQGFASEIDARAARQETLQTEITRMSKPVIDEVICDKGIARITLRFIAHIKTSVGGEDDAMPERTEDLWTFERPVADENPNWRLAATQTV